MSGGRARLGKSRGASVTVYPDGPLVIRGDFALSDLEGNPVCAGRIAALCRCGRSVVKPLCDGSHKRGALPRAVADSAWHREDGE